MKIERVLIANDSYQGMHSALEKAALIEHFTGATVEAASVVYDPIEEQNVPEPEKARLVEALLAAERQGLRNLFLPFKEKIAWPEPAVLWGKRADEAILAEADSRGADLIIKPLSQHSALGDLLHTPLDWRLIRNSLKPVLVSKSGSWQPGGKVMVAFDVETSAHEALNLKLLDAAATMAAVLDAELHAVTVYPDLGQTVSEYQVAMDYKGMKEDMRVSRTEALQALLEGTSDVVEHVEEGNVPLVIERVAGEISPTLLVVGTHAHAGVKKLVLGNTAEAILGRIEADIMTLR